MKIPAFMRRRRPLLRVVVRLNAAGKWTWQAYHGSRHIAQSNIGGFADAWQAYDDAVYLFDNPRNYRAEIRFDGGSPPVI